MVILQRLKAFFARPTGCGPLCRDVSAEIDTLALSEHFERLASAQSVRCTPPEM